MFEVWTSDLAEALPDGYEESSVADPLRVDRWGTPRGNNTKLVDFRADELRDSTLVSFTLPEGAKAGDALQVRTEEGDRYAVVPNGVRVSTVCLACAARLARSCSRRAVA